MKDGNDDDNSMDNTCDGVVEGVNGVDVDEEMTPLKVK